MVRVNTSVNNNLLLYCFIALLHMIECYLLLLSSLFLICDYDDHTGTLQSFYVMRMEFLSSAMAPRLLLCLLKMI